MKGPRDSALGLLEKASHDLVAAKATVAVGEAFDTVCFHAQQAAEKSLKALLAVKNVEYPKRHDIGELVSLAKAHFPEVAGLEDALFSLTPYAVEMRYDDEMYPDLREARHALAAARKIHALARRIIAQRKRRTQ